MSIDFEGVNVFHYSLRLSVSNEPAFIFEELASIHALHDQRSEMFENHVQVSDLKDQLQF